MGICSGKQHQEQKTIASEVKKFSTENILKHYRFGKVLGSGSFGTVKVAYHLRSNKAFAVKTINKYRMKENFQQVLRELDILTRLDHPNIIKVFEEFQDEMYFHFVMEYSTGGELLERVLQRGYISENETRTIMRQLFSAIAYLHNLGIVHRDLKPENILFSSTANDAPIKIIDFGLSKRFRPQDSKMQRMHSKVGTPIYVAPEVLSGDYTQKCDDWSLGCIMHVLLCGDPPFYAKDPDFLQTKIKQYPVEFKEIQFKKVSRDAIDIIRGLLMKDPKKRMSADEVLQSKWMLKTSEERKSVKEISSEDHGVILRMLKTYANASKMKKETLKILLNHLKDKQIAELQQVFLNYDEIGNGVITVPELEKIMGSLGFKQSQQEIQQLIAKVSLDDQVQIQYSEFLSALINSKQYLDKERLWNLFKYFDADEKNYINKEDVQKAFAREGRELSSKKLNNYFSQMDDDNDGKIDFEAFCKVMQDDSDQF